jgi:hypothetical protein
VWILYTHTWVWVYSVPLMGFLRFVLLLVDSRRNFHLAFICHIPFPVFLFSFLRATRRTAWAMYCRDKTVLWVEN